MSDTRIPLSYMVNYIEPHDTFTSQEAVALFKEHTGFEFHPTVPGQLLARRGIKKIPSKSKPSRFDGQNWEWVWEEMFYLALRRCRFHSKLHPPKKCLAPVLFRVQDSQPTPEKKDVAAVFPRPVPPQVLAAAPPSQQTEFSASAAIRVALEAARRAQAKRDQELKTHLERQRVIEVVEEEDEPKPRMRADLAPQSPRLPLTHQPARPAVANHNVAAATWQARDLEPHPTRNFIEVPFEEKDEAKWLGARWDLMLKKWYVPSGLNRKLFRWPDALLPPVLRAIDFPSDEQSMPSRRRSRKKKAAPSDKSAVAVKRLQKELDDRLQFVLDKHE